MLRNFLFAKDIDILHLQEVTTCCLDGIPGYMMYCNIATKQSGMAFVFRNNITLADIGHPNGLAMAGWIGHVFLVNIHTHTHTGSNWRS